MEKEMNIDVFGADQKIYEVGFHVIPALSEDGVAAQVASVRDAIASVNGTIIAEGAQKKIDLAYPMTKVAENKRTTFTSAYFAWFKFEAEPKGAKEVAAIVKANNNILRFLLVKTVREDTMAPRKLFMKKKDEDEAAPVVEEVVVSEEEIDASIDKIILE